MRAVIALAALALAAQSAAPATRTITVVNPAAIARPSETIAVRAADLAALLSVKDVRDIHVRDARSGQDLLTQAVDNDDDGTFDEVIFQADLAPSETRTFAAVAGTRRIPKPSDFRAYGRFVRERRDDFAWENDLVAHRMYGTALETWAQEPLTSSAIDVWVKRTRRLVINDWYMVDDYHRDTGEGADFYSAGKTRGCGGSGIWKDGKLFVSRNFTSARPLANGPIRVMFELAYDPWDIGGGTVAETKRITLDAGRYFSRIESTYRFSSVPAAAAAVGIGIRVNPHAQVAALAGGGGLRVWEPIQDKADQNGWMGCAVIAGGAALQPAPVDGNHLVVVPLQGQALTYHAGSAWDRGGQMHDLAAWDAYIAHESARLAAPVTVRLGR